MFLKPGLLPISTFPALGVPSPLVFALRPVTMKRQVGAGSAPRRDVTRSGVPTAMPPSHSSPRFLGWIATHAILLALTTTTHAAEPVTSVIYPASDFPALANGVTTGLVGEATVSVWAPSRDDWSLTTEGETITLKLQHRPGDTVPRWHDIGTAKIAHDRRLKIVVVGPEEKSPPEKTAAKKKARSRPAPRPVPAILRLSTQKSIMPSLDLLRGRIDTIEASPDRRRGEVRTNQQGAEFEAPSTAEAWLDRRTHLRDQLLVTLGLWPIFPKAPLKPRVFGKLHRDGYTIEKIVLETFPGFTLSGNLYRPETASGKIPGILCPHGHWEDGRLNPEVQQRCIRWAKLGCAVFMYDMVGYNDSKPFTHEFLNDRLRHWGLSLPTLQTWNSIRALDWLTSLPDVDVTRIGCTGESGGGTQTFLLTALDDRIKFSAPVVMVSDSFQGGCVCENAAGLRIGTDNVEFAAMCAPRPLFMVGASGDWTKLTMERAYPAIRGVYSLIGSTNRVGAQVFDFPHNYNQTSRNAVYAAMGRWLLGIDEPEKTREGKQQPEKPEDLLTFGPNHPAPMDRKTPEQLESYLIETRRRQLDAIAPTSDESRWEAGRRILKTALAIRTGIVDPPYSSIESRAIRRIAREGYQVLHAELDREKSSEAIPIVRLIPARSSGRLTVIVHPSGKAGLASGDGEPTKLVRSLLAMGEQVVGLDPLFVGESIDPRDPIAHRPETVHSETYNPSTTADQMQDLATVLTWCRSQEDVRELSLVALGESGYQVMLARPMLPGLARTAIELPPPPTGSHADAWPSTIDLPGREQSAGLRGSAALSAPEPLWIFGRVDAIDPTWARASYEKAGSPSMLVLDEQAPTPEALARWIDRGTN